MEPPTEAQELARRLRIISQQLWHIRPNVETMIESSTTKVVRKDFPLEVADMRRLRALAKMLEDLSEWALKKSEQILSNEPV